MSGPCDCHEGRCAQHEGFRLERGTTCRIDTAPDRVSEAVRADLLRRSVHGWRKYGAGLDTNPAPLADALKHAYEEALDLATYLKWSILKLEGSPLLAPDQSRGSGLGTKVSPVRRCQGGAVDSNGRCLACFADQGEQCLSPAADLSTVTGSRQHPPNCQCGECWQQAER